MNNYIFFQCADGDPRYVLGIFKFFPNEWEVTTDFNTALYFPKLVVIQLRTLGERTEAVWLYKQRTAHHLRTKIIVDGALEGFCYDPTPAGVEQFKLLFDGVDHENDMMFIHNTFDNIQTPIGKNFHVDFHAVDAYTKCILQEYRIDNTPVVLRPPSINLLIGKLKTKYSRFLAAYYFYKHELLDTAVLGINAFPEDIKTMMEQHPLYNDKAFYDKIISCLGPADDVLIHVTDEGVTANCGGWPFDPTIFSRSGVSYVCETYDIDKGTHSKLVTEKFYRAVINHHPFIIQACPGQLDTIHSLGYESFSSIITEDYNNYSELDYSHVEKSVLAAKELLSKIPYHSPRVQEIVDYNFNHLLTTAAAEHAALLKAINEFLIMDITR